MKARFPTLKVPVTIVVGIICKDGIVMATDSRTLDPITGKTSDKADKLSLHTTGDRKHFMVAQAGNALLSSQAVEILAKLAKDEPVEDDRTIATLAENAIAELKLRLKAQYHGSGEELQRRYDNNHFDLMLTYDWKEKPVIFTIGFGMGIAHREKEPCVAMGCSDTLADYFLGWCNASDMHIGGAVATAVYVVSEVKKKDVRCGGPTKAAVMLKGINHAMMLDDALIEEMTSTLGKFDTDFKSAWQAKLRNALHEAGEASKIEDSNNPSSGRIRKSSI